jgi:hypothetical protein
VRSWLSMPLVVTLQIAGYMSYVYAV